MPGACVYLVSSLDDSQVSCWSWGWECPSHVGFLVGAPFKSCPIFFNHNCRLFQFPQECYSLTLVTSRLMNKTDLASEEELATTENAWNPRSSGHHSLPLSSMVTCQVLQALNSNAELIRCTYGKARCFAARYCLNVRAVKLTSRSARSSFFLTFLTDSNIQNLAKVAKNPLVRGEFFNILAMR